MLYDFFFVYGKLQTCADGQDSHYLWTHARVQLTWGECRVSFEGGLRMCFLGVWFVRKVQMLQFCTVRVPRYTGRV